MDKLKEAHDRNVNDPRRKKLLETVREKGKWWAIVAMIDGSIGYHTPKSAEIRINQLMKGRYVYECERAMAIFNGDSISEIEHDFRCFKRVEEDNPEKVERLIAFAKKVAKMSWEGQSSISMLYPTHVR
ncbi:MAG: hypothetical protein U9O89_06595 [Thermoproteota archaeon]|nr:hypothetical protein [Thermoproteota archaeon]